MFHIYTSCNAVDKETIFCLSPNKFILSEHITLRTISFSSWPGEGGWRGEWEVEISSKMLHWPLLAALFTLFWMKLPSYWRGEVALFHRNSKINIPWLSTHVAVGQTDNVETLKQSIMIAIDSIITRNVPMCCLNICCNTRDTHVEFHQHKL